MRRMATPPTSTLLVVLALLSSSPWHIPAVAAASNDWGVPVSWGLEDDPDARVGIHDIALAAVDRNALLSQDDAYAIGADANNTKPPLRWGVSPDVSDFAGASMRHAGNWTRLSDTEHIWRLRFTSPGALSQQLIFSTLWIPAGSGVYIYADGAQATGACDASAASGCFHLSAADTRVNERFTSPIVPGSALTLEFYTNTATHPTTVVPRIHVARVVQGFRDVIPTAQTHAKDAGSAGVAASAEASAACNNDATCPLVDASWRAAKQSVVQIVSEGGGAAGPYASVCTGTLLNTPDRKPYVLSAYHCLEGESVEDWAFVFNYERPCEGGEGGEGGGGRRDFLNGARLVWADMGSDVILLELDQDVPVSFDAYYAGWSALEAAWRGDPYAIAFHHPVGDYKKVSIDRHDKGEMGCPFCDGGDDSHVKVC